MQFNSDENGVMHKLPKPSVDTGMGLERIAAVLQHVHSNYEIDLFKNLLAAVKKAVEEAGATDVDPESPSLKVIADHIRACTFSVADGILPGNEGRAYVLRRICRRAIRHGYKLGARKPFFAGLVDAVVTEMGEAYPEIKNPKIKTILAKEEERFAQTLSQGMQMLEDAIAETKNGVLDGQVAFKLHDTYGFPVDLTADVCRERDMTVDMDGFDAAMQEQRDKARASAKFKMAAGLEYNGPDTAFTGYTETEGKAAKVIALYLDGEQVVQKSAPRNTVTFKYFALLPQPSYCNTTISFSEVRLWNVARTSTQLKNNVNNVDPKSEGLLGYWKMNEGHGYTFEDATGNGNTAECEYSRAGDLWDPQSYGPATGLEWAPDMDNM